MFNHKEISFICFFSIFSGLSHLTILNRYFLLLLLLSKWTCRPYFVSEISINIMLLSCKSKLFVIHNDDLYLYYYLSSNHITKFCFYEYVSRCKYIRSVNLRTIVKLDSKVDKFNKNCNSSIYAAKFCAHKYLYSK